MQKRESSVLLPLVIGTALIAGTGCTDTSGYADAPPIRQFQRKTRQPVALEASPATREEALSSLREHSAYIGFSNRRGEEAANKEAVSLRFYDGWETAPDYGATQIDDELLKTTLPFLSELTSLSLETTSVGDEGLSIILDLPNLRSLTLGSEDPCCLPSPISDQGLAVVGRHPNIVSLRLTGLPITDKGISNLAQAPKLERLQLINCDITPMCLSSLARIRNLERLDIGFYNVHSGEPWLPANVTRDFDEAISDEVRDAIAELNGRLKELSLGGDPHPSLLDALSLLTSLRSLGLGGCRAKPATVAELIQNLPNLRSMSIHPDSLDDQVIDALRGSPVTSLSVAPSPQAGEAKMRLRTDLPEIRLRN